MRFKDLIAAAMLVATAYFSLATSSPRDAASPTTGTYYVISDCTTPPFESVVTVSGSAVIAPVGVSFTDFGFPLSTISQSVIGPVAGGTRECTVTYGENGTNHVDDRWLYSCFDNGKFRCSIYSQPQ
jgi:hypothetical protein